MSSRSHLVSSRPTTSKPSSTQENKNNSNITSSSLKKPVKNTLVEPKHASEQKRPSVYSSPRSPSRPSASSSSAVPHRPPPIPSSRPSSVHHSHLSPSPIIEEKEFELTEEEKNEPDLSLSSPPISHPVFQQTSPVLFDSPNQRPVQVDSAQDIIRDIDLRILRLEKKIGRSLATMKDCLSFRQSQCHDASIVSRLELQLEEAKKNQLQNLQRLTLVAEVEELLRSKKVLSEQLAEEELVQLRRLNADRTTYAHISAKISKKLAKARRLSGIDRHDLQLPVRIPRKAKRSSFPSASVPSASASVPSASRRSSLPSASRRSSLSSASRRSNHASASSISTEEPVCGGIDRRDKCTYLARYNCAECNIPLCKSCMTAELQDDPRHDCTSFEEDIYDEEDKNEETDNEEDEDEE